MGVSENRGTPKSSILIGFSIINHPFWGIPIFWRHPCVYCEKGHAFPGDPSPFQGDGGFKYLWNFHPDLGPGEMGIKFDDFVYFSDGVGWEKKTPSRFSI